MFSVDVAPASLDQTRFSCDDYDHLKQVIDAAWAKGAQFVRVYFSKPDSNGGTRYAEFTLSLPGDRLPEVPSLEADLEAIRDVLSIMPGVRLGKSAEDYLAVLNRVQVTIRNLSRRVEELTNGDRPA